MICGTAEKPNFGIGFLNFLRKFEILDKIPWPNWAIDLSIEQICRDISKEGIKHSEVSLSINKYVKDDRSPEYVSEFISECFEKHAAEYDITVGLLLSLRYDSPQKTQLRYAEMVQHHEFRDRFIGIDLIGNEDYYDAEFYAPIFKNWGQYEKVLRAHVGEMPGTGDNVKSAIKDLNVTRIAHGIQADDETLDYAKDRGICFDLALHSNLTTGAIEKIEEHPLKRMVELGCTVTLNTDDPIQFGCTVNDEFELAVASGLITGDDCKRLMQDAYNASEDNKY